MFRKSIYNEFNKWTKDNVFEEAFYKFINDRGRIFIFMIIFILQSSSNFLSQLYCNTIKKMKKKLLYNYLQIGIFVLRIYILNTKNKSI